MVDTNLTCQYCGEPFETKSDLQDHEANCLEQRQIPAQKQQQGTRPQPATGRQQPTGKQQQTTGSRTRGAGSSGEDWNGGESGL